MTRDDVSVILGMSGGSRQRRLGLAERADLWEKVRRSYAGRGGSHLVVGAADYIGHEFVDDQRSLMLHLEERC
jgi:hypothetical protein